MSQGPSFVGMPAHLRLDAACTLVAEALGESVWLVGSALVHDQWRDIDVRVMMDDGKFLALCGTLSRRSNPFWSLLCLGISEHLSKATGLPVDFQIHPRSAVKDEDWGKPRYPLGSHVNAPEHDPAWKRRV